MEDLSERERLILHVILSNAWNNMDDTMQAFDAFAAGQQLFAGFVFVDEEIDELAIKLTGRSVK